MSSLVETIGNTPLVQLRKLCPNPLARIFVKLEYFSPSGSIKDRIVAHILNDAEKRGLLKPGGCIVENTSGNTGAAVAMLAAQRGYRAILTMPDKVSQEKQDALKAYGAKVVVTPTSAAPDSPEHYVNTARRLAAETPGSFMLDQYDNPKNPEAHYLTTGPEVWKQTGGQVDVFVAAGSTGGTVSGVGRYLKEQKPGLRVVMPDPFGSIYYYHYYGKPIPADAGCSYQVEGIGEDHIAKAMDFSVVDEMIQVDDACSFATARRLASEEGILGGGSGGMNVYAALKVAEQVEEPTTIVTVIPDSGIKYLSKFYNDEWMRKHGYSDVEV